MKKWWWILLVTMMLLKTKGIIWSYIGLIWPYWKSLELNYFTNIYLNECISIVLLSLLEKRIVNRSFSFRNPKESWISSFVMIVEISTEHRALNHIPFIYLIFLGSQCPKLRSNEVSDPKNETSIGWTSIFFKKLEIQEHRLLCNL